MFLSVLAVGKTDKVGERVNCPKTQPKCMLDPSRMVLWMKMDAVSIHHPAAPDPLEIN